MAHRVVDHIRPDFSLPSLAQGTAAIVAAYIVAVGLLSFFMDSDVFAELYGLPDRPVDVARPSKATSEASMSDPSPDATNPWVYILGGRNLALGLVAVELVRRAEWRILGLLFLPLGGVAAIDTWATLTYGSRAASLKHALAVPLFLLLGGYLALT